VFGIVKQSGGHVTVESEPGRRAVHVWLPRIGDAPSEDDAPMPAAATTQATVLLVEDDEAVREFVAFVLRTQGYRLLIAEGGAEALALSAQHGDEIDLLLCDVVMPQLSGVQVAEQLIARRPQLRVVFMSGHPADPRERAAEPLARSGYLEKPFDIGTLIDRVRRALA
jgi:DNA-binding NtrC family response regulator